MTTRRATNPVHFRYLPYADFALGRLGCGTARISRRLRLETFSSLNDLLPGLRKMRGIHEPSLGERRVPYGRDHERHFPDRLIGML